MTVQRYYEVAFTVDQDSTNLRRRRVLATSEVDAGARIFTGYGDNVFIVDVVPLWYPDQEGE